MKPKVKTVSRIVNTLRDPEPNFVSIVDHGANQTPFAAFKRVKPGPMPIIRTKRNSHGETSMGIKVRKKNATAKKAARASGVLKLVFDGGDFDAKASVEKWLTDNDWDASTYTITKSKGGDFEAVSKDLTADSFDGALRDVEVEEGIMAQVGTLKASDAGDDEAEDGEAEDKSKKSVKKGEKSESQLARKFDPWAAYFSGGDSLRDVIKDAMKDGLPPGFYDITFATEQAMANVLRSDDSDKKGALLQIGEELGTIIYNMHDVFAQILEDGDATDTEKSAATHFMRSLATSSAEKAATRKGIRAFVKIEETGDDKAKKSDAYVAKAIFLGSDAEEIDTQDKDDKEKKSVQTSAPDPETVALLKSIKSSLDKLEKRVDDVAKTADKAAKATDGFDKRIKSMEDKAPKKKSVSDDGDYDDTEKEEIQKQDAALEGRLYRNAMGL